MCMREAKALASLRICADTPESLLPADLIHLSIKVMKGAKIRNRYNQVPHLIQDTYEKVTNSQLDATS